MEKKRCKTNEEFWKEVSKMWNWEKNEEVGNNDGTKEPWKNFSKGSEKEIWLNCDKKGYHIYKIKCLRFSSGSRCSFCCSKLIHPLDSFGQYIINTYGENGLNLYWDKKNTINPFELSKRCHKKVWIKCQNKDYHGSYEVRVDAFARGDECPYCSKSSEKVHELDSFYYFFLSLNNYNIDEIWSDKNKINSKSISPKSDKKVWWKCKEGRHSDYKRSLSNSFLYNFRCPECVRESKESLLQEKVRKYISSLGYSLKHEFDCALITTNPKTHKRLPYDNEVIELKLIVEVHGQHHYHVEGFNKMKSKRENTSPERELMYRQTLDRFKRIKAILGGYNYLEIPYWADDKNETWKKMIYIKIKEIENIKQHENTEVRL